MLNAISPEDERKRLLDGLREQYCAETYDAARLTAHARRMYYPQFRDRLLRIAAEEQVYVQWLREQIHALGEDVPEPTVTPKLGHNSWGCLLLDLEEEKRSCADLLDRIHAAVHVNPEIAEGLLRIRTNKQRHYEELQDMWMKSDPYTLPASRAQNKELEQHQQEWLVQQKMQWLEQQRAEWEAGGKLVPWAEWERELEYRWTVNELPSLELVWARWIAERETENERDQ
jgi:rubrerythrin